MLATPLLFILSGCSMNDAQQSNSIIDNDFKVEEEQDIERFSDNKHLTEDYFSWIDEEDDRMLSELSSENAANNALEDKVIETFAARNENYNAFFEHLSEATDENYILNPGIPQSLSINLKNTTPKVIRMALEKTYDIQFTEAGPSTWIVEPKRPDTRFYQIDHIGIKRSGSSNMDISSQTNSSNNSNNNQNSAASLTTEYDNSEFWSNLESTVRQIIDADDNQTSETAITEESESSRADISKVNAVKKQVTIDQNLGIMAVTAFKEEHRNVQLYLDSIREIATQQVIIEARILQVALDNKSRKGLNLTFNTGKFGNGGVNLADPDMPVLKFDWNKAGAKPDNGSDFAAAINFLEKQGKVEVISSPKISAMNNQLAVIKVGEEKYFATQSTNTTNSNSNNSTTTNNVEKEALFSGIAFYIVPSIIHDEQEQRDLVTIHLRPSISHITTERTLVSGTGQNNDTSKSTESYINLPKISTTQVDTIVRLFDNEIAVIGGLTSLIQDESNSRLPHGPNTDKSSSTQKIETVILLKAHIVNDRDKSRAHRHWSKTAKAMRG